MNENIQYQLPIEHLSYSALKTYCNNRAIFKKIYIMQQGEFNVSPSMMVGKMAHKFAEVYFSENNDYDLALDFGYRELDGTSDSEFYDPEKVDRQKMKKEFIQSVQFFMEEKPNVGEVLATELNITTDFLIDQTPAPLPVKAVSDLVTRMDDGLHIWDWKFTSRPRKTDEEQPDFILQSIFNRITVASHYGEEPVAMHYVQVKTTKNRDNSPQIEIYTIKYKEHPEYFTYFDRMYRGFVLEIISPNVQFLPNFADFLNGQEAWQEFTEGLVDFDLPEFIDHSTDKKIQRNKGKVRDDVDFIQSKANVESTPDEQKISAKLMEFGINIKFKDRHIGSNVTLYTYEASRGVQMSKLKNHEADLELALGVESVVIHAPLKGRQLIGIEVAKHDQETIEYDSKVHGQKGLVVPVGIDVYKQLHTLDIASAPHVLVAGATGMGKSVMLNVMLQSLLNQNEPEELLVEIVDPKGNEFIMYEDEPHVNGIYTDIANIKDLFFELMDLMDERYSMLRKAKVRNIDGYNKKMKKPMHKVVVIVDELADIILNKEVMEVEEETGEYYKDGRPKTVTKKFKYSEMIENRMVRLAQKARAVGIHLVCATQRPSTDVVLGVLKANFPSRIAFATATSVDSSVIIDQPGAEKLIGNGDLLFMKKSAKYIDRLQGLFVE